MDCRYQKTSMTFVPLNFELIGVGRVLDFWFDVTKGKYLLN